MQFHSGVPAALHLERSLEACHDDRGKQKAHEEDLQPDHARPNDGANRLLVVRDSVVVLAVDMLANATDVGSLLLHVCSGFLHAAATVRGPPTRGCAACAHADAAKPQPETAQQLSDVASQRPAGLNT